MGKPWFPLFNSRRRPDGSFDLARVTGEQVTPGLASGATGLLAVAQLAEVPAPTGLDGSNFGPIISPTGLSESRSLPATGEYHVNYNTGQLIFHEAEAGRQYSVDYWARGSLIEADDINSLWQSLGLTATGTYIVGDTGDWEWDGEVPITVSRAIDLLAVRGVSGTFGTSGIGGSGADGPTGPPGVTGIRGETGIRGPTGLSGDTGIRGETGPSTITEGEAVSSTSLTTTEETPTTLTTIPINTNEAIDVHIHLLAIACDHTEQISYLMDSSFYRPSSGDIVQRGSPSYDIISEGESDWDCEFIINNTTYQIEIEVIGEASRTIKWIGKITTQKLPGCISSSSSSSSSS